LEMSSNLTSAATARYHSITNTAAEDFADGFLAEFNEITALNVSRLTA
jgi:hypothetical protein